MYWLYANYMVLFNYKFWWNELIILEQSLSRKEKNKIIKEKILELLKDSNDDNSKQIVWSSDKINKLEEKLNEDINFID